MSTFFAFIAEPFLAFCHIWTLDMCKYVWKRGVITELAFRFTGNSSCLSSRRSSIPLKTNQSTKKQKPLLLVD